MLKDMTEPGLSVSFFLIITFAGIQVPSPLAGEG